MAGHGNRKLNLSILGSYHATNEEHQIAYEIGKGIANWNINAISGGQKGVMYSLCRGIHENRGSSNTQCTIVGVLPSKGFDDCNEFLDVAIPTGSGGMQNTIVPMAGDIILAVGGSAGTLTEIAIAWQHNKNIGLLGSTGWAHNLAHQRLDNRRDDSMPHFVNVEDALIWAKQKLQILGLKVNT